MMGITHITVGMASWAALAPCKEKPLMYFGGMLVAGLAGLLPDIDHPKSLLGRKLWFISAPLSSVIGHRGVTHSFIAIACCGASAIYWHASNALAMAITIGYASHVLADYLTIPGVPLFWPNKKKYRMPGALPTNSAFETAFLMMSLLIIFMGILMGLRIKLL